MSAPLIYVAGPLGANDEGRKARVEAAVEAGRALIRAGFEPFVPHVMGEALDDGFGYERWMTYCLAWVERCHATLRIPGFSPGADREVKRTMELKMPVFYSVDAVIAWPFFPSSSLETEKKFYMRDARTHSGNCALWWQRGNGYTTDLAEAQVFSAEAARKQAEARETDIPVQVELAERLAHRHVGKDELEAATAVVKSEDRGCNVCSWTKLGSGL